MSGNEARHGVDTVMKPQAMTIRELCITLGIGRTAAYAAMERGEIPNFKIGRRRFIPKQFVDALLSGETRNTDETDETDASR